MAPQHQEFVLKKSVKAFSAELKLPICQIDDSVNICTWCRAAIANLLLRQPS